jgi:hypothetical protein
VHGHTGEADHLIALTIGAAQEQQWRTYQRASAVTVRTQLRLALLHECLSTATLSHNLITEHLTRPYAQTRHLPWSDISAALTLWWWHHNQQGRHPLGGATMLDLVLDPTLAVQVTFPDGANAPVLAPPGEMDPDTPGSVDGRVRHGSPPLVPSQREAFNCCS